MGALGSAVIARENPFEKPVPIHELINKLENRSITHENEEFRDPLSDIFVADNIPNEITNTPPKHPLFLGIDIGSVSTKGAVIDSEKRLIASGYVPTAGKPVEALKNLIEKIISEVQKKKYPYQTSFQQAQEDTSLQ
jgi:activator of 2-hydroxyglutaryl-CoA dehydratase